MGFLQNLTTSFLLLLYFLRSFPKRIIRLLFFLRNIFSNHSEDKSTPVLLKAPRAYFTDLFFYVLDLIAFPEMYDLISGLLKMNTRGLGKEELAAAKKVYGNSIDFRLVRMDTKLLIGDRRLAAAYVGVCTINFYAEAKLDLLIHELIHVWQYQHFGSVYIPRSLRAQRTMEAYNYLGEAALAANAERGLLAFNYEQQGEVIADYFRIKHHLAPRWSKTSELTLFEPYVSDLHK